MIEVGHDACGLWIFQEYLVRLGCGVGGALGAVIANRSWCGFDCRRSFIRRQVVRSSGLSLRTAAMARSRARGSGRCRSPSRVLGVRGWRPQRAGPRSFSPAGASFRRASLFRDLYRKRSCRRRIVAACRSFLLQIRGRVFEFAVPSAFPPFPPVLFARLFCRQEAMNGTTEVPLVGFGASTWIVGFLIRQSARRERS